MTSYCFNCGASSAYNHVSPVDEDLAATWGLSSAMRNLFNKREGSICPECGANGRAQGLAAAILKSKYGYGQKSLKAWVTVASSKKLKVAELNSCHQLHETLKNLKGLVYAEYGTPSEQDIQALTYKDNQFDMVLHSETLEHIPDPQKAMSECRRAPKEDGVLLFTTPVIWGKKTRKRAHVGKSGIVNDLPPSYHGYKRPDYLVFYEYGRDIDELLGIEVCYQDWKMQNYVFVSKKRATTIKPMTKIRYRLLESTALFMEDI